MTTVAVKKITRDIQDLKRDVAAIKFAMLREVKNGEGGYRPEFVKEILRLAKESPVRIYKKGDFTR